MVDVQHQHQRRFARPSHAVDLALGNGAEVAPVGQARERIAQRQRTQLVDQRLQIARRRIRGQMDRPTSVGNQRVGCGQSRRAE
jgi:hypothetical protein